jgi:hypothetical protein
VGALRCTVQEYKTIEVELSADDAKLLSEVASNRLLVTFGGEEGITS